MTIKVEVAVTIAFLVLIILPWLFTDDEVKNELLDYMLRKEVRQDGNRKEITSEEKQK